MGNGWMYWVMGDERVGMVGVQLYGDWLAVWEMGECMGGNG